MSSIGIDIIEVKIFRRLLAYSKQRAWRSYFFNSELQYCFNKSNPEIHLAVKFAAKEAIIKAFAGQGITLQFNQIEIYSDFKLPQARIYQVGLTAADILISLSHSAQVGVAVAFVSL